MTDIENHPVDLRAKLQNIWETMDMRDSADGATLNIKRGVPLPNSPPMVEACEAGLSPREEERLQLVRAQHRALAPAGMGLLAAAAAERVSFSKAQPPPERALMSDKALETAYFGSLKTYVKQLPSKHVRDYGEGPLWKMNMMQGTRESRHNMALEAYRGERIEVAKHMKEAVQQECNQFKARLADNDDDIEDKFDEVADDNLMLLEEESVKRVWEEVSAHFPLRHAWIQELSGALAAVERDRQVVMRDTLAQLVAVLMQNAHVGPGVVERVVEKEAALVNHEMNDNKRSTAELVRRLSRREVELERERRQRWEDAMGRWRRLRTLGAIKQFQEHMRSKPIADPPARAAGAEQLVREEIQAQKVLAKHIASVANMLPPKSPLTVPKVENWQSIANSNADAWDQAISRGMMSLHDQEEELQQRCWDRYNGLVADVARYNGFPPEEQNQMLQEDALTLVHARQKKAVGVLQYLDSSLNAQAAQWRSQWGTLAQWLLSVAELHDYHKVHCKELHRASESEVAQSHAQHDADKAACEKAFDEACVVLRQSGNNKDLESNIEKVLVELENIKEEYRIFHGRTTKIVEANPPIMQDNNFDYERKMCELFRLKYNCPDPPQPPPPEPEPQPEPEPEPEPAGKKGAKGKTPDKSSREKQAKTPPGKKGAKAAALVVVEPEPEPAPPPPPPPSPPKTFVHTHNHTPFVVAVDLFDALYRPPPPPEPEPEPAVEAEPEPEPEPEVLKGKPKNKTPPAKGKTPPAKGKTPPDKGKPKTPEKKVKSKTPEEVQAEEAAAQEAADAEAARLKEEAEAQALEKEIKAAIVPLPDIPVEEPMLRTLMKSVQEAVLTDMEEHSEQVMKFAKLWEVENIEDLTMELDANLRQHRPRAGRVEEDLARAREVELLEQQRRANNFIRSYVRLVQGQQAKQAQLLATLGDELQVLLGKMSTATEMLVTTPAVRALAAKHREMDKLKRKIEAKVEKQCDILRDQLQDDEGELLQANQKFIETFKSFHEGGNYTNEKIAEIRHRLDFVIEQSGLARKDVALDIDELQEGTLTDSQKRYETFVSQLDPHREDLAVIEELETTVAKAKEAHQEMFEFSNNIATQIKLQETKLMGLVNKGIKQKGSTQPGLCLKLLTNVDEIRKLLLPRCKYLGALRSTIKVPKVTIDIEPAPEGQTLDAAPAKNAQKPTQAKGGSGKVARKSIASKKAGDALPAEMEQGRVEAPEEEWETVEEVPSLLQATETLLSRARAKVLELSEKYYNDTNAGEKQRPITRPERIPATLEEMVAKHEIIFQEMQAQSESHNEVGTKEVRAHVVNLADYLIRVPGVALGNIQEEAQAAMLAEATQVDQRFDARHRKTMDVQETHKLALKPSLVAEEVDKLQLSEVERAHKAVDSLYEHARTVMEVLGRHARRLGGTLEKAALLLLRLMDATVLPEDLASMQLDEHLLALRRKNLRQLQRLLRGAQTHPACEVEGSPPMEVENRTYLRRTWKALEKKLLRLQDAGWSKTTLDETVSGDKGATVEGEMAQGDLSALKSEENTAEDNIPVAFLACALDTPCQQAAVNARDRVFRDFKEFYYREIANHKQLILQRLRDEMLWKGIWEELVAKCKGISN